MIQTLNQFPLDKNGIYLPMMIFGLGLKLKLPFVTGKKRQGRASWLCLAIVKSRFFSILNFLPTPANPAKPRPMSSKDDGSGTVNISPSAPYKVLIPSCQKPRRRLSYHQARPKRSRFMTLFHTAMKSCRNFSRESSHP
jgi:hypothetical protein